MPTTHRPRGDRGADHRCTEHPAAHDRAPDDRDPHDGGADDDHALGFWIPAPDGDYDSLTQQAVMAFQKHAGLSRDGLAGPATMAALETAAPVAAREGGDHVELDLERQLLVVVRGGRTLAFNTSTGTEGWRTPPGRFTVQREIDGVRKAPLGDLYRPEYFNAGIAVHGSPSIPGRPASHRCARVHDRVMDLLWADGLMPVGTPVWVY